MSIEEVDRAILNWQIDDERAQAAGHCRYAAQAMMGVAQRANVSKPLAQLNFVAWPKAMKGDGVHYAFIASDRRRTYIYNPVAAAQFPRYNGDARRAPGMLRKMRKVRQVI